ncbi:DNA polymerase III subunit delta' [Pelosinus baikalensis]|uniref:DNA polymerase III subunit delta' n=1 Tax=Pelosinus baikalensis TaxID=2892015 RepID=A0ABS8HUF1_9FIRM|nr:DNA polymerase III subunit delta' [Pelosinus baikalensis]MCC5466572.1 DNA polymerase III subunit delta' [Pelosinus baikalensis]
MKWTDIIGHKDQVTMLRHMESSRRMPHAVLFAGPKGIGKNLVANVVAAALLCSDQEERPCGRCHSCRQISYGSHPDFLHIAPDGTNIKIEQIRMLQQELSMASFSGQRRVCIIDGAELMTTQAANSLLKVLEDPPGEIVFLLLAANKQMLLTTIISRCMVIAFQPLADELLAQDLMAKGYLPETSEVAARLSGGRMGIALALLEPEGLALRNQALEMIQKLMDSKLEAVWHSAGVLEKMERNDILEFIKYVTYILRDILLLVTGQGKRLLFNIDVAEELCEVADMWSERRLVTAIRAVETARRALLANANTRLTSEALLIRIYDLAREV